MEQKQNRSSFSGKLGFVLSLPGHRWGWAISGRFPYLAAKYGGGIFLLIYIVPGADVRLHDDHGRDCPGR